MRVLLFVIALLFATTAIAQPSVRVTSLDDKVVASFFKETKSRQYYEVNAFEQEIGTALKSTRDLREIAKKVAPKFNLPLDVAEELVSLWIRWVQHEALDDFDDEDLSYEERDKLRYQFEEDAQAAFLSLVRRSHHADVVVERATAVMWKVCEKGQSFDDLLKGAPNPKATAIAISQTTICSSWRVRALKIDPTNPVLVWSAVEESTRVLKAAQRIAMLEWLRTEPSVRQLTGAAAIAFQTAHGRRYINELWDAGLVDEGVKVFETLPVDVRAQLVDEKQPVDDVVLGGFHVSLTWDVQNTSDGGNRTWVDRYFAVDLAAAYIVLGRVSDAAGLMHRFPFDGRFRRTLACREGKIPDSDPDCKPFSTVFDKWLVLERRISAPEADPFYLAELQFSGFGISSHKGLWTILIRKLLNEPNYADLREQITKGWSIDYLENGDLEFSDVAKSWLSPRLNARVDQVQTRIAEVRTSVGLPASNRADREERGERRTDPPGATAYRFKERPLGKCGRGVGVSRSPKKAVRLDREFEVVRVEKSGDVVVAISLSQSLDPAGEVSGGGYWVHISRDDGKTWEAPRYTGLAQFFPYVVATTSCKRMWAGDHLDVAVEINELDRGSITYPPVGLQAKRRKGGLMLTIPLSELDRDSDGDLITDIEEDHLLLKRDNPDSDGDGIRDGIDPLPNVANRKLTRPGDDALAAVLGEIFGKGSFGAIIEGIRQPGSEGSLESYFSLPKTSAGIARSSPFLIRGKPEDYASIKPERMTLVYTDEQIRELEKMTPVFAAIWVGPIIMNRDRSKGLVRWSTGWAGGAFRIERDGRRWKVVPISSWIT